MNKILKNILAPFVNVPRETLVEDLLIVPDYDYLPEFCDDFPELKELADEHEEFVAWEENHDPETLAALNLHDTALFIDKHRDDICKQAKIDFKGLL